MQTKRSSNVAWKWQPDHVYRPPKNSTRRKFGELNFMSCYAATLLSATPWRWRWELTNFYHPPNSFGDMYICMTVCLSVCYTMTFESLHVESSFLVCAYNLRWYWWYVSSSYMKVIGSRSRSQEQKGAKIPIPATQNFDRQ